MSEKATDLSVRYFRPLVPGRKVADPVTGKQFVPAAGWRVHARSGHFGAWAPLSPAAARKVAPDLYRLAEKMVDVPTDEGIDHVIVPTSDATGGAVCPVFSAIFTPRKPFDIARADGRFLSTRASDRTAQGLSRVLHKVLGTAPAGGPAPATAAERERAELSAQRTARLGLGELPAEAAEREAHERSVADRRAAAVDDVAAALGVERGQAESLVRAVAAYLVA